MKQETLEKFKAILLEAQKKAEAQTTPNFKSATKKPTVADIFPEVQQPDIELSSITIDDLLNDKVIIANLNQDLPQFKNTPTDAEGEE